MSGAPLPLLGTFHELSVATREVRAAVEFYEQLGFEHFLPLVGFAPARGVRRMRAGVRCAGARPI